MAGVLIAWLCAGGLVALGLSTIPFPALLSRAYGAPVEGPAGLTLVRAMGLRDLALGVAAAVLLLRDNLEGVAVILAVTSGLSLLDFVLVLALRKALLPLLIQHATGCVLGAAGAVLLFSRG